MALEEDIDFLEHIPTLHILGREALRILAISTEAVHIRGGDQLFEEGEPADCAYVVVKGAIALRSTRDRNPSDITVVKAGTLIGEMALVIDTMRPATATALESATLLRIPRIVFLRTLEGEPGAAMALRELISRRLEGTFAELDLVLPKFEQAGTASDVKPF